MAFRQYRRASSGIDAGVHALLFWLTIITAPVWVPILLIVGVYQHFTSSAEQETARHRMRANEIELSDMRLQTQAGRLEGRLRNKSSQFTVSEVGLSVVLQDCDTAGCETVGQNDVRIGESTPAGQARDFSTFVYFSGSPRARRGQLQWNYQVLYVEARPPGSK